MPARPSPVSRLGSPDNSLSELFKRCWADADKSDITSSTELLPTPLAPIMTVKGRKARLKSRKRRKPCTRNEEKSGYMFETPITGARQAANERNHGLDRHEIANWPPNCFTFPRFGNFDLNASQTIKPKKNGPCRGRWKIAFRATRGEPCQEPLRCRQADRSTTSCSLAGNPPDNCRAGSASLHHVFRLRRKSRRPRKWCCSWCWRYPRCGSAFPGCIQPPR